MTTARIAPIVIASAIGVGVLCGWDPDGRQTAAWVGLSALVLIASIWLMHAGAQLLRPSRLSIPSFFYIGYFLMIYAPAFVVFTQNTPPTRDVFLLSVESVMLTVPLGVLFANHLFRYSRAENERYFAAPMEERDATPAMFHVTALFMVVAGVLTAIYFSQLDWNSIPLFYMFQHPNDVDRLMELREEAFKLFDPRWNAASASVLFYGYLFLRTLLFPFVILLTFGYFYLTRQARWGWTFALATLVGGFYAAASIARAPLAAIFMRLGFFYYLARGGRITRKASVALFALMLAFPVLVTALAYGSEGYLDAFGRVGRRFLYTPAEDLYVYFEIFPSHMDYQYGGTLAKPILKLLNLPYFYIENYVYRYQFPTGIATGHANAAFVSNLHASNPNDPLFVFETNPALANLEVGDRLFQNGVILENVDGFEDATHKFVLRGVPHVLSMKTSIAADTGDGTTNPPIERTGWGGDGASADGSLRQFLTGAVTQHYTTCRRCPSSPPSCRAATKNASSPAASTRSSRCGIPPIGSKCSSSTG